MEESRNDEVSADELSAKFSITTLSGRGQVTKFQANEAVVLSSLRSMRELKLLPIDIVNQDKSDEKSIKFRCQGNELYRSTHYDEALECYNKSVAYACSGSEALKSAFGNRSEVLKSIKRSAERTEDIDRALMPNYPQTQAQKLNTRRRVCDNFNIMSIFWFDIENTQKKVLENFEKSFERNTKIPCATKSIKIVSNKVYGRHIVATKNIKAGEIIAMERSFVQTLNVDRWYTHCTGCLRKSLSLIPCVYCPNVLFCTEACRDEAWRSFHEVECPILMTLNAKGLITYLLPIRLSIQAMTRYSFKELKSMLEEVAQHTDECTAGFTTSPTGAFLYDSGKYNTVVALDSNARQRSLWKLDFLAEKVEIVLNLFKKNTVLKSKLEDKTNDEFVRGLIFRNFLSGSCNTFSINEQNGETRSFGSGLFPFHSLFNHSCIPNVCRGFCYMDGKQVLISLATFPIEKGQPLWLGYTSEYYKTPKAERQKEIGELLCFECACAACLYNYPLLEHLPILPNVPTPEDAVPFSNDIPSLIQDRSDNINKLAVIKPFPNKQVAVLQDQLKALSCLLTDQLF